MIGYLKGKIVFSRTGILVVDVGGVGYRLAVNPALSLPAESEIALFVHEHIREDAHDLYGFDSYYELELFEKLISVNGVGPKVALLIMASGNPEKIVSAIGNDDVAFFVAISGIGKKVAAKIILDLRSKLTGLESSEIFRKADEGSEVVDALTELGYKKVEVLRVISKMPEEAVSVEDKIRWCLKNLGKK